MSATPQLLTDERLRAAYAEGAGIHRIVPRAVAVPWNLDELRRLAAWACSTGTPLIPRGAGSGMAGGAVGGGVIVDLSRGFTALETDAGRRAARTGASVTWAALDAAARPLGLRLPPDPSSGLFATCGGLVSTNAAGPRSLRYGSVRRWVEAVELVTPDGEFRTVRRGGGAGPWRPTSDTRHLIARHFPRTPKNSSGYALDAVARSGDELDVWIGAEGTLGFVTAVHWRLDPIPPAAAGVALGFSDLGALGEAVPLLLTLEPSALELLDQTLLSFVEDAPPPLPGLACLLLVEFERESAAAARGVVGDAVRGLKHLATHVETAVNRRGLERLWSVRRLASPALARLPETRRSLQIVEDGCVPPRHLAEYVAGLRAAAAARDVPVALFGHAGDGHVHVNALPDTTRPGWREAVAGLFADVTALQARLGGTPSGEHGDGRLRAGVLERFFGPAVTALFGDVKCAYDPRGICNPGVILPAADWTPLAGLKVGPDAAPIPDDIAARLREVERTAAWATPKLELAAAAPDT